MLRLMAVGPLASSKTRLSAGTYDRILKLSRKTIELKDSEEFPPRYEIEAGVIVDSMALIRSLDI